MYIHTYKHNGFTILKKLPQHSVRSAAEVVVVVVAVV